jgi:hypothetical protein
MWGRIEQVPRGHIMSPDLNFAKAFYYLVSVLSLLDTCWVCDFRVRAL